MSAAQQSVLRQLIAHKLELQKDYRDYAIQMELEAAALIKELLPIGAVVVGKNGTLSIVTGHKDNQLAICNLNSTNSAWIDWRNVEPKSP